MRLITNVHMGEEPQGRLTELAAEIGAAFEASPNRREGDRAIIIVEDDTDVGTMLNGYDGLGAPMVCLMGVLQALDPGLVIIGLGARE
jgi:hypothetical protein